MGKVVNTITNNSKIRPTTEKVGWAKIKIILRKDIGVGANYATAKVGPKGTRFLADDGGAVVVKPSSWSRRLGAG